MPRLLSATICLLALLVMRSECAAQDFKTRRKEILKKVNATMAESSKQVPQRYVSIVEAKLDRIGLKGEERESMKETYLSWFKALGKSEKADENDAILADLLGAEGEKQDRLALKYHFAEHVLVWRVHDPQLKYFAAPTEPDPLFKKLIKTQIEETIRVLEFAERGKLFIGYPNECDVKTELIEMRERFKALQKGPLK